MVDTKNLINNLVDLFRNTLSKRNKVQLVENKHIDVIRERIDAKVEKTREKILKEKFREHQVGEILVNYRKLSYEEQEQIETDFYNNAHERTVKRYFEQGVDKKGPREDFVSFIEKHKDKYSYLIKDLTSYENYIKQKQYIESSQLNNL